MEDSPAERRRVAAAFYATDGRRAFGRAELRFLHWEIGRGVLHPVTGRHPGSPWWRAVNARLLRDKGEADLLGGGVPGRPSSPPVALWLEFIAEPTPLSWYRAHNASIAAGYLDHETLAAPSCRPSGSSMNVALARVLFTHAMLARPCLALGRLAALGPRLADPGGALSTCSSTSAARSPSTTRSPASRGRAGAARAAPLPSTTA